MILRCSNEVTLKQHFIIFNIVAGTKAEVVRIWEDRIFDTTENLIDGDQKLHVLIDSPN